MLYWALMFLIVALVAALFGFGGIAGTAAGIAQVLFFESDEPCAISYKDKRGKYQGQRGPTPSRYFENFR